MSVRDRLTMFHGLYKLFPNIADIPLWHLEFHINWRQKVYILSGSTTLAIYATTVINQMIYCKYMTMTTKLFVNKNIFCCKSKLHPNCGST